MGLAELRAVQIGYLVGSDHDAARVLFPDGARLHFREAQRRVLGRFAGARGFVNIWALGVVFEAKAVEELAAVARGGGKNKVKIRCHATNCIELAVFSHQIFFDK